MDGPRATVYTERNEGIQVGVHHEDVGTKSGTVPVPIVAGREVDGN